MADRVVSVKVKADVAGAVTGLRKVKASVDDLTKADLQKPKKAFDSLATKGALVGGLVAVGIGKAISSFAEFDAAMSGVAANSGATGEALNALRETAIKLGSDTQFSATEAAQGINELAKAGVSTADIMNGGIKGALDLAAAGQIGVAEAAETTASALNQFQQDGSQAVHVADLLSNAANAAQGGVSDMGQALGQAGVAAHSAGLNIDETTTLLALFAKAGLIGSDAGTSLKTMMQRLSAPTDKAAATLKDLGIQAYDAGGNFIGAEALLRQMSEATKDMSTQQRAAAFNVIFGTDAIRAASIAASAGADGYKAMATEVTKAGGAAENAAKLTDNLKGDLERLGGAIDTAFIQSGSAANGAMRTLVQGLGGLVDVVSKIPAPLLLAATAFGGIALALPKGISVYKDFTQSLDTLGISLDKVSSKAPRAAKALNTLGKIGTVAAIGGAADALTEWANASIVATPETERLAKGLTQVADGAKESQDFGSLFAKGMGPFRNNMESTADALDNFAANARAALDPTWWETATGGTSAAVGAFEERTKQLDAALTQMVTGGSPDKAAAAFKALADAAVRQGVPLDKLKTAFPQYATAIANAGDKAAVAGPQMDGMSEDVKAVQTKAEDAKTALDDLKKTLEGFGSPLAAQRAAQRDYQGAVQDAKDALKSQTDELVKQRLESKKIDPEKASKRQIKAATDWAKAQIAAGKGFDIATEAGSRNEAALDAIADKTKTAVTETFNLTHNSDLAAAAMKKGREDFIKQAIAAGRSATEAATLADNLGLIPKDVKTAIALSGVPIAKTQLNDVTGQMTTLGKTTAKPQVKPFINKSTADAVEARMDQLARNRSAFISISAGLTGAASGLFSSIQNIGGSIFKRATGGPIDGIGTATSDSNLALLSRGEHVLTAAEVQAAGGHAAIFALRKALLTGGVAFRAQGGPIATSAYRAAPSSATFAGRMPTASEIGAAVAAQMPPQVSVYSGQDATNAARTAINDWEWRQLT